jgi:hypothetical protein
MLSINQHFGKHNIAFAIFKVNVLWCEFWKSYRAGSRWQVRFGGVEYQVAIQWEKSMLLRKGGDRRIVLRTCGEERR